MKLMQRFKKKIKKLDNRGSSIVMVVVALAFIGIIVGALLSAAMYGYRQKLQNLNAKNNFYNVEQSMQEIYAGVGINTIEEMQRAYTYTLTNMVYFDTFEETYVSLDDDSANFLFKSKFMEYLSTSAYFSDEEALADCLASYITNDTVKLDKDKLSVQKIKDENGNLDEIIIKNVTLTRTQPYKNPDGKETYYTQTVSADIEIVKPEFNVNFSKLANEYPSIFDYALVADAGVEVGKFANTTNHPNPSYDVNASLGIKGNIYAASDFYNKKYNSGLGLDNSLGLKAEPLSWGADDTKGNVKLSMNNGEVWYDFVNISSSGENTSYDGEKLKSMYSGLYIDNASVSIMADQLVVPGSVSVMNSGDLTVYSGKTDRTEIWTDEIVLAGASNTVTKTGPAAYFNADLYVRDDTEINAFYSEFSLNGSYYGYGDSTTKDSRVFVSTVDPKNFTSDGTSTATTLRDHYNSSAIIINGQNVQLNLANANLLYIAGRAYIELSKITTHTSNTTTGNVSDTYEYKPINVKDETTELIRDYKTAESISVKYNQLMYDVSQIGTPYDMVIQGVSVTVVNFANMGEEARTFLSTYFPTLVFGDCIPCFIQNVGSNKLCYIDFDKAYEILNNAGDDTYSSADNLAQEFVEGYSNAMTQETLRTLKEELLVGLQDVSYNGSNVDSLKYGDNIYSSGAITTKSGASVKFVTNADSDSVADRLLSSKYSSETTSTLTAFNDDLEMEYLLRKWTLNPKNKPATNEEKEFIAAVKSVSTYGEASITPINNYLLMSNLKNGDRYSFDTDGGHIWISNNGLYIDDKTLQDENGNYIKNITGIIITKGDVYLGYGLESFKGTIIAGGKIYIDKSIKTVSAGYADCKAMLDDCLANKDNTDKYKLLTMFRMYFDYLAAYEASKTDPDVDVPDAGEIWGEKNYYSSVNIEAIDYGDVVSVTNWQKTVGGDSN